MFARGEGRTQFSAGSPGRLRRVQSFGARGRLAAPPVVGWPDDATGGQAAAAR
ncbi:hypothetical protein GCM10023195_73670 [Actinoallomurus liliacearum]|uniref:Uncharacterized protein n=1 Tax=Actinoallomurus liliacearum TaxID=1080073 RepID=A0ABP8TX77_9ACTN